MDSLDRFGFRPSAKIPGLPRGVFVCDLQTLPMDVRSPFISEVRQ